MRVFLLKGDHMSGKLSKEQITLELQRHISLVQPNINKGPLGDLQVYIVPIDDLLEKWVRLGGADQLLHGNAITKPTSDQ